MVAYLSTSKWSLILEYAEGLDFDNKILDGYRKVCHTLKHIRTCISGDDFRELKKLLFNEDTENNLQVVGSARGAAVHKNGVSERDWHPHPRSSIRSTRHGRAAEQVDNSHIPHGDYVKPTNYNLSDTVDILKEYCQLHTVRLRSQRGSSILPPVTQPFLYLYIAIRVLQRSLPAYTMLRELLECAIRIYQLRVRLQAHRVRKFQRLSSGCAAKVHTVPVNCRMKRRSLT